MVGSTVCKTVLNGVLVQVQLSPPNLNKMERELFNVPEDEIEDFTSEGSWKINDDIYKWITTISSDGDGIWYDVITQRERDGKFFSFSWGMTWSQTYRYSESWKEVFPRTITTIVYE